MPTFQFFKGKVKVDEMTGADAKKLEDKIIKWIGSDSDSDAGVKGHVSYVSTVAISSTFILTVNSRLITCR